MALTLGLLVTQPVCAAPQRIVSLNLCIDQLVLMLAEHGRIASVSYLAADPSLREQYVSVEDVSKMVIKRYTGWWDDLPSSWSPASLEAQAVAIAELAGGVDALVRAARTAIDGDVVMACHLADWAWLAAPDDPAVQELVLDVYEARIVDPASNTQEMLAYIDAMTAARRRQLAAER